MDINTRIRIDIRDVIYNTRTVIFASVTPITICVVTRIGLYILVYLSLIFLPVRDETLERAYPQNLFLDGWTRWDAAWYRDIAEKGYTNIPKAENLQRDTAFFPLYPLLIRLLNGIFLNSYISGLIVSNTAFLVAVVLIYHLTIHYYNFDVAKKSILLLCVFPFSFYFSAVYTESLFLLSVTASFYLAEKKLWALSGIAAAAATATKMVGLFTVFALIILYLEQIEFNYKQIRMDIVYISIGLLGITSYMIFLWWQFGNAFQFITSQYVSGWAGDLNIDLFKDTIRDALHWKSFLSGNYHAIYFINIIVLCAVFMIIPILWYIPHKAYLLWVLLNVCTSIILWRSMGRFVSVLFPLFIILALILRYKTLYYAVLYISVIFLSLFSIMYSHWYWVA